MYYLVDEIIVSPEYEQIFLDNLNEFRQLYLNVSGVAEVRYLKTTLETLTKLGAAANAIGAENLTIVNNPTGSYLLLIAFESQQKFQDYHDNSSLAKQIHRKVSSYFGGKQLTIRAALHGNEI
jgi:heme-degrading monooxygenase HmoA